MEDLCLASLPIMTYRVLAVAPSFLCDAGCRHCFLPANLRRQDQFDAHLMHRMLEELPATIRVVSFTGGEPFLWEDRFLELLKRVQASGRTSAVVTNALWARDWKKGERLLAQAFENGLRGISVSVDAYHRPVVPRSTVVKVLRLGLSLGMSINVRGVGKSSKARLTSIQKTGVLRGQEKAKTLFSLDNIGEAKALPPDRIGKGEPKRCLMVLTPFVLPSGRVLACCSGRFAEIDNPVLSLGVLREKSLQDILNQSSRDYLLAALLVKGPGGLMKLIDRPLSKSSVYQCEACVALWNQPELRFQLRQRIASDKELRQEIVGSHMIYETCFRPDLLPPFGS